QSVARMEEIHERMQDLRAKHRMSRADGQEWDELKQEFDDLEQHVRGLELDSEIAQAARGGGGGLSVDRGGLAAEHQPYGDRGVRDRAMRVLDRAVQANRLPARGAEIVESLCCTGTPVSQSWVQRYTAAAGSEDYERAFAKLLGNPTQGHLTWSQAEH